LDSMAFSPPLTCTQKDIDDIVNIFDQSVRSVMARVL
jgi:adenosylmethionine-8-amino-7-oxononanoate aminotransferase